MIEEEHLLNNNALTVRDQHFFLQIYLNRNEIIELKNSSKYYRSANVAKHLKALSDTNVSSCRSKFDNDSIV